MTFRILKNNCIQLDDIDDRENFLRIYMLGGIFYDHKKNTNGAVYEENSLIEFVNEHHNDPINCIDKKIEDHSDFFALKLKDTNRLIVVETKLKKYIHPIIKNNYSRFEVYVKK